MCGSTQHMRNEMYRPEWDEDNREDDENDILNDDVEATEYPCAMPLCDQVPLAIAFKWRGC